MSLVEQDLCFYIEESPSIPWDIELCPGVTDTVDLTGATYEHVVKSADLSSTLATGTVTPGATNEGALASGTITYTTGQMTTIGVGRHKHKFKVTTSGGVVYIVIPPSDFTVLPC